MKKLIKYAKYLVLGSVDGIKGRFALLTTADGFYKATNKNIPFYSQFIDITEEWDIDKIKIDSTKLSEQGYKEMSEYTFWGRRCCGIVCVKMILDAFGMAPDRKVKDLIDEGMALGGYIINDKKGKFVDLGWFHKQLLQLANKYGLVGQLKQSLTPYNLAQEIISGNLVIASVKVPQRVHLQKDGTYFKKDYKGPFYGHLILITGVEIKEHKPVKFIAHNPTGLQNYAENSEISFDTMRKIFNGRGILIKAN